MIGEQEPHLLGSVNERIGILPSRLYFNFTKSRAKIAHIPAVIGYVANCASRSAPPRGIANVSTSIARAVSIPSTDFIVTLIVVPPHPLQMSLA